MTRYLIVAAALLAARPVQAQLGLKASGGLTVPVASTAEGLGDGWHGGIGPFYSVPSYPQLAISGIGGYHRFSGETVAGVEGPGLRILDAQLNLVYRLIPGTRAPVRPFITGGGGVFNTKATGTAAGPDPDADTSLGFNAGLGIEFRAVGLSLVLEGRYTSIFSPGENLTYVPVSVGVVIGGR